MWVSFYLALACFILTFIGKDINDIIDKEWVNTLIGVITSLLMILGIGFLYLVAGFGLGYL